MSEATNIPRLRAAAQKALVGRSEVAAAYAFGSRIRGRALPRSDLDIAIVPAAGEEKSDPLLAERLANRLSEALGGRVEVDCRLTTTLPLALNGRIVTEGVLIYDGDPTARLRFETDVRRLYFDFLPLITRDAREGLLAGG